MSADAHLFENFHYAEPQWKLHGSCKSYVLVSELAPSCIGQDALVNMPACFENEQEGHLSGSARPEHSRVGMIQLALWFELSLFSAASTDSLHTSA